ncbi:hypothetical protein BHE74_00011711 [Ensete ventricosum]|nr:hypothetical protein BHE74_00011711 [Ensete ventricosum]
MRRINPPQVTRKTRVRRRWCVGPGLPRFRYDARPLRAAPPVSTPMRPTAFVADPTGDANVQVEVEIAEQRLLLAGEAMHDGGGKVVSIVLENLHQALVGVTLMHKHREFQFDGQGQVFFEDFFLLGAWREIPIEIQSAFTYRTHAAFIEQTTQALRAVAVPVTRRVGVDTGGAGQALATFIECYAEFQGLFAALDTDAGEHQLLYAGGIGTVENGLVPLVETGVGQVDADINELHGATSACGRKAYQSCRFIRKSKNYNEL